MGDADPYVEHRPLLNAVCPGDAQIMSPTIDLQVKFPVVDAELSALHARASGHPLTGVTPWGERLERHSLTWVGAFIDEQLIGFVHACWDGGAHAFLLDTAVDPNRQRKGIGARLVQALVDETTAAGCDWLHVDYEPHLASFYTEACGFNSTFAGLRRLASGQVGS